jgi:hypothetical protein
MKSADFKNYCGVFEWILVSLPTKHPALALKN